MRGWVRVATGKWRDRKRRQSHRGNRVGTCGSYPSGTRRLAVGIVVAQRRSPRLEAIKGEGCHSDRRRSVGARGGGATLRGRGYGPPRRAQSVACLEPNAEVCPPVALRAAAPSGVQSGTGGGTMGLLCCPVACPPFAATDSFRKSEDRAGSRRCLVAERPGCRAGADLPRSFRAEGRG